MRSLFPKAGWMIAGVLALYVLTALAGVVSGGPLDPPGPPAPSLLRLDELPPSWSRILPTTGVDPCNTARFQCVLANQAVLDHETGLVWQRSVPAGDVTWIVAANTCNTTQTGGRGGWRMPTVAELTSVFDPSQSHPALSSNHPFLGVNSKAPWTSSASDDTPGSMQRVAFSFGIPLDSVRTLSLNAVAWCVRGGAGGGDALTDVEVASGPWYQALLANDGIDSCHSSRFTCVLGDAAVLDHETGLVWERTPGTGTGLHRLVQQGCYQIFSTGGRGGWRLPTAAELGSLAIDNLLDLPPAGHPFVGIATGRFWSSSIYDAGAVYVEEFDGITAGTINTLDPVGNARSWCVRGPAGAD